MDYKGCKNFYTWSRSILKYDNFFWKKNIKIFRLIFLFYAWG